MAHGGTNEGPRTRADAARNRDRILDAAAVLLAKDAGASLADIADEAGLSRATAYRHFPDVEAVRSALLQEAEEVGKGILQSQLAQMFDGEASQVPLLDQLLGILRVALPVRHRWASAIAGEPVPDAGLVKTFAPVCKALLRRAQQAGEVRDDVDLEVISEALVALGVYSARRVHSDGLAVDSAMQIVATFFDGLRSPGPARGERAAAG